MDKVRVATKLEKAIDKTLKAMLLKMAKEYLKPFKDKPWYRSALDGFIATGEKVSEELRRQAKAYSKALKDKDIYKKPKSYKTEEYLDERYNKVVVNDIRDTLVEMNKDFESELSKVFGLIDEVLILEASKSVAGSIGMEFNFNKFDKVTRDYLRDKKIKWAKQVQETTEKKIKQILVDGYEMGLGSYDVAQAIQDDTAFSFARAESIARTETISSCNYADKVMWDLDENIIGKEWSATGDGRTRGTHSRAHGQKVAKDKPFIVGGYKMMYPGDSSLGAPAKEVINCRCTMYPIFEGEKI